MSSNGVPILKLEEVTKSYAKNGTRVTALAPLSLEIASGEFVAIQGASGCGKTTLLLTSGGLLQPDSGKVAVDGQDFYELASEKRARYRAAKVGFVFQQFHLIPYLTVLDNVLAPAMATPIEQAEHKARALLDSFGLKSRINHLPGELSTGEQQRTALARALLPAPRVLLADEPTGNLDRGNAEHVLNAFRAFADNGGAVLWVTHDESLVDRSDRCIRFTK